MLMEMAEHQGVDLRLLAHKFNDERIVLADGQKQYSLQDAYAHADFVTYPSLYEGFGNALIEAFYFRKPVLVNRYSIFVTDIEPKRFQVVSMNGFVTRDVVAAVRKVLEDREYREAMVEHNYRVGRNFFSYSVLRRKLRSVVTNCTGVDEL